MCFARNAFGPYINRAWVIPADGIVRVLERGRLAVKLRVASAGLARHCYQIGA